jgi:hypothetical protein
MKATLFTIIVVVVFLLVWIKSLHTPAREGGIPAMEVTYRIQDVYSPEHLQLEGESDLYRYDDLQLYPVFASQAFLNHHQHLGPYRSLQEALDKKEIVITELFGERRQPGDNTSLDENFGNEEPDVNTLFIENISSDTIIILGGEIVKGGKQDRMIAQDFMVMPHSGKIDIAVYCVEHGRWTPSEDVAVFQVAMDIAPNKIRKAAAAPEAQKKVWDEVADLSADLEVHGTTGALADALADEEMMASIKPYKEHLQGIDWPENVVGVIAVMGNEIVGCDIFAQHQLFKKYYPSLLSSYSSDAYKSNDNVASPYAQVHAFLQNLIGKKDAIDSYVQTQGTQLKHGKFRIHVAAF